MRSLQHSGVVALAAYKISKFLHDIDSDVAHNLGLLHDIGKFSSEQIYMHPLIGYRMLKNSDCTAANICITHPFVDFNDFDYILFYCKDNEEIAGEIFSILKQIQKDTYIELIQLCDKLSGIEKFMRLEEKFAWYHKVYGINQRTQNNEEFTFKLLQKFDKLCKKRVYDILQI